MKTTAITHLVAFTALTLNAYCVEISQSTINVNSSNRTITQFSNDLSLQDSKIYSPTEVDTQAEYSGGIKRLNEFFSKSFKMPSAAMEAGVSGKISMEFVVEKDGSVSNIKYSKDLGFGTGEEAVRVLKKAGKFKGASKNGQSVRALMTHAFVI